MNLQTKIKMTRVGMSLFPRVKRILHQRDLANHCLHWRDVDNPNPELMNDITKTWFQTPPAHWPYFYQICTAMPPMLRNKAKILKAVSVRCSLSLQKRFLWKYNIPCSAGRTELHFAAWNIMGEINDTLELGMSTPLTKIRLHMSKLSFEGLDTWTTA